MSGKNGRWFRMYADAMRHPKVASLSDRDFRLWVTLLSVAAENEGKIPETDALKRLLKARLDHLLVSLKRLISLGLIDPLSDGYAPHNWAERQYKSDTSTDRVREHRQKRNVSETPPDTDTETETEKREVRARPTVAVRDPSPGLPAGHGRADLPDAKIWRGLEDRLIAIPEARLIADPFTGPMIRLAAEFDFEREVIPSLLAELRRPGGTAIRSWSLMATRLRERLTADRAATARGDVVQIRTAPQARSENPLVAIGMQAMRDIEARRA